LSRNRTPYAFPSSKRRTSLHRALRCATPLSSFIVAEDFIGQRLAATFRCVASLRAAMLPSGARGEHACPAESPRNIRATVQLRERGWLVARSGFGEEQAG